MTSIDAVSAREVLDSRGEPTVRVVVESDGSEGQFTVPAGASTGQHEALERRDGGTRYRGRGVREAVQAVNGSIAPHVLGRDVREQRALDESLVELDGTESLTTLGANAVLGVSGAVLRTASRVTDQPLFRYVSEDDSYTLPMPMINVISGGLHAAGGLDIQDVMIVPTGAETFSDAVEMAWEVRQTIRDLVRRTGERPLVADEGGFAPSLDTVEEAFELVCTATEEAGFGVGRDVSIAVDVAATHFYDPQSERYTPSSLDGPLRPDELIEWILEWVDSYPVVSLEDPLSEDAWSQWVRLSESVGDEVQIVGDDLLVTDSGRVTRAIESGTADAVLIKPNQAGTMTRTLDVLDTASTAGLNTIVSARSGESCDSTIADLAVGRGAGQIKIGSLARSERLAKYNRLLGVAERHDCPFADVDVAPRE